MGSGIRVLGSVKANVVGLPKFALRGFRQVLRPVLIGLL